MTHDATGVEQRLATAMKQASLRWAGSDLEVLPDSGLAHTHVRLVGHGALARIPKQSQMDLPPEANLAYQAACFERAGPSGHTPRLIEVLPPCEALPRGALIVEEIVGRRAVLPHDLAALATALARLHQLPLPAQAARAPLTSALDPMTDLLAEIEAQAAWLDAAQLEPRARRRIDAEIDRYRTLCAQPLRAPLSLISFDAHPGNFMVRADGRAVLVDLEKCRFSHASLDLAHATLYTSTTWDAASHTALSVDEVAGAYAVWSRQIGPAATASSPWHLPLRRAMWLWSITWCAKWRVASRATSPRGARGEDWSSQLSAPALIAHVRGRVDHYLSTPVVEQVLGEIDALEKAMPRTQDQDTAVMIGPHRP
ncbi:MAG: phosphotransferase [Burkholderiaceae bacterium]